MAENKVKRCAIYTRKSVEVGLDMEFNSLDAQREAAENYIASQKSNGWRLLPDRYDDGGFSGGNTNRPALKPPLADCEAGKIDISIDSPAASAASRSSRSGSTSGTWRSSRSRRKSTPIHPQGG